MILKEHDIIRISQVNNKRIYGIVTISEYDIIKREERYTIKPIYKPSPKSQLRVKSVFTKNKFNLKTN